MARAPPTGDDEPDVIEFGIPVLDDRLEEASLSFPADRDEVRAAVGDLEVPYDAAGHTLRVGAALDRVEADRYESRNELLDALHPAFEGARGRAPAGLVATLRSYLPF